MKENIRMYALTGGIGSGKSTALAMFADLGALTLSADRIVHELYMRKDVIQKIKEMFGDEAAFDDGVDRKVLAQIVFSDAEKRRQLEVYIHPLVHNAAQEKITQSSSPVCVYEIPLYFQLSAERQAAFDGCIYIQNSVDRQTAQAEDRGHGNHLLKERQAILGLDKIDLKMCDYVIKNTGDLANLAHAVGTVYNQLLAPPP